MSLSIKSNKKVKNARSNDYEGIRFKSLLERYCYIKAKEMGYNIKYEPYTFTLMPGFKVFNSKIITPVKDNNKYKLKLLRNKIRAITYSPDFMIKQDDTLYIIETKGRANDVYPLKKKMLFRLLEEIIKVTKMNIVFMEPHNQSQVNQCLNYIKDGNNSEIN